MFIFDIKKHLKFNDFEKTSVATHFLDIMKLIKLNDSKEKLKPHFYMCLKINLVRLPYF